MGTIKQVIEGNYCIGCGVCPFLDTNLSISFNENGEYQAVQSVDSVTSPADMICPFANSSLNEDTLGKELFSKQNGIRHNDEIGYYLKTYVGYAISDGFRDRGSSGGMVSWIIAQLFTKNKIDAVIHVKESPEQGLMYSYQVSHSIEEMETGAKSKYYPIQLSNVLDYVKNHDERFAIVGIPCFIKAVRQLEAIDNTIASRIRYHIGLVCGHLKSTFFALSEAWEAGIPPQDVTLVDFRYKLPGHAASDYAIKAEGVVSGKETEVVVPTRDLSTTNWGYGYFKYNACEYCDDVLAETADITCGDAWLPGYDKDSSGTNVVVVRTQEMLDLITSGANEVHLEEVPAKLVAQSQRSGLRHRREGLAYRLYLKDRKNGWRPTKRVQASNHIPYLRKKVYEDRMELTEQSFVAFREALKSPKGMKRFNEIMQPIVRKYQRVDNPIHRRLLRKMKSVAKKMHKKLTK
ncbi:Coenzyme F420 hydrogenase/dehydrogenase, beta subunit C-terminal domain [Bifidobacterium animalis]|uniref:Oxidoreductase n=1 Tax=Bifidobacterium animalis subsp. lactis TaxID=302911 RepID=A0A8B3RH22_BIFAN|nr:Coenzyme F420 hydrogenase/dehydrogenase, beta subunit C-terminal domain [Bifidobacterium animalis]RYM93677.1 oxidoreductase [Bifidobacterium animalis subsp. lactis]